MSTVKLDEQKAAEIAAFYHAELQKTMARYNHIKSTLESLGENAPKLDLQGSTSAAPKAKRRKKGKPGPASVWDKKILKRLKEINKPVTYEELTDDIMAFDGYPAEKRANIKASIINVTYRLRKRDRKINTFSMGTREKFIALRSWFDSNGEILDIYKSRLKVVKKKTYDGPKRPVGRPKGSKNKKGAAKPGPKKSVGRPKGSKNKKGAAKPGPKPSTVAKKNAAPKAKVAKKTSLKKAKVAKKKAPAKATKAKKTVSKKSVAKKSIAKAKAPAKKAAVKKAPAKKAAVKKASAKKSRGSLVIKNK